MEPKQFVDFSNWLVGNNLGRQLADFTQRHARCVVVQRFFWGGRLLPSSNYGAARSKLLDKDLKKLYWFLEISVQYEVKP